MTEWHVAYVLYAIAGILLLRIWLKKQKRKKDPLYTNNPKNLDWYIGPWKNSVGMPESPTFEGDDLYFTFPGPGGSVNELECFKVPRDISKAKAVRIRFKIEGGGFVHLEDPSKAATLAIVLHRKGDDWSGRGKYEEYRWYCKTAPVLKEGTYELLANLTYEEFKPVVNKGTPEGLEGTKKNLGFIGIGFGGPGGRAHGVYANEPSRFTLLGAQIEIIY